MSDVRKVNDDLSVAGQVTPEDLQQAAAVGFKSVLNLRSPDEATFAADESQQAEAVGLQYANTPLSATTADPESINAVITQLNELPTPVLVHCGAGLRATGITLIALAKQENWTLAQLTAEAERLHFNLEQPHVKKFIEDNYT